MYFFQEHLTFFFFFFWFQWVFVAPCWLSLVAVSGAYSSLWCEGFSLQCPLLWSTSGRAQSLWCVSLVALWPMGSSWSMDPTLVPGLAGGFLTTGQPWKSQQPFKSKFSEGIIVAKYCHKKGKLFPLEI